LGQELIQAIIPDLTFLSVHASIPFIEEGTPP
jgi:hypothetical protein